jgi:excisionase family DNA binding protein
MPNDPDFLCIKEVAAILRVSHTFVQELVAQKRIPHLRLGLKKGGRIRIKRTDVERWISEETDRVSSVTNGK